MVYRESEVVELKETYIDDIRKEIIAFANTNGGTLYVGVKDNGEVIGVDNPDGVMLQISNSSRDAIKPDITMFISYETIDTGAGTVVAVHVQRGTSRPYYLSAKGLKPSGVFIRQGTSSAPASDEAIRRMIKETDGEHFEDMRSLNQGLTFEECNRVFHMKGIPFGPTQMKTLGLINAENLYTNLALLLSDQCPHIIKAATFNGSNRDEFQDRKEFTGSLIKQLNDAYSYIDLRNQTRSTYKGLYRNDTRDYPEKAIREALLNAIEHRDYSFPAPTLIAVYANCIEFVSYGGLAGGVQMEDILNGLSVCRNPKLAGVFYRLELVEAYGTGLQKIQSVYAGMSDQPEFHAGPSSFRVVLPNMNLISSAAPDSEEYDEETRKALEYIREHGEVTRSDVEKQLGLNTSAAIRLMKKLRDNGLVTVTGKGKSIRYHCR